MEIENLEKFARNEEELKRIKILERALKQGGYNIKIYKHYISVYDKVVIPNKEIAKYLVEKHLGLKELPNKIIYFRAEKRKNERIKEIINKLTNKYRGVFNVTFITKLTDVYVWYIEIHIVDHSERYNYAPSILITLLSTEPFSEDYDEFLRKFINLHFQITSFTYNVIKVEKRSKISDKAKFVLDPKNNTILVIRR